MLIHPAITGGKHYEFEEARSLLLECAFNHRLQRLASGMERAVEILPVAEGTGQFADRDLAEFGGLRWARVLGNKSAHRPDLAGQTVPVVMADYEPGEWREQFDFLTQSVRTDDLTLKYLAHISGATQSPGVLGASPSIGFYAIPSLHGVNGYTADQLAELRRMVECTRVTHVFPSMRPRRSIGAGITFAAQRRRVQVASEQLLNLFADSPVQVWPEVCPIIFGNGAMTEASTEDGQAQMEGFVAAGITDLVLWLQGETLTAARWFADATHAYTTGLAAAAPAPGGDVTPAQEVG
jgi:hypothetical protein